MSIDALTILVLALGFWQGFNRGIITTLFNIVAYLFGIMLAFKMTPTTSSVLSTLFKSDNPLLPMGAFMVNLGLILFMLRAAAGAMEKALAAAYLGFLNRTIGGAATGLFYVLLFSVLLWFGVKASLVRQDTLDESKLYHAYLEDMPLVAKDLLVRFKPMAVNLWNESAQWMDKLEQYGEEKTEQPGTFYKPDRKKAEPNNHLFE
jgi:membrane protein required for colicin V production